MAKTKADKAAAKAAKKQAKADASDSSSDGSGGKLVTILGPVVLGAASFATVFLLPTADPILVVKQDPHSETKNTKGKAEINLPKDLGILELSEIIVSIRNEKQILRIGIALEAPRDILLEIEPNDPRLRDAFMGYLRAIDVEQLQDAAFMAQLRAHLLHRSKLVLNTDSVHSILITDFLVR